jgi:zinc transport system ATP-binding protein
MKGAAFKLPIIELKDVSFSYNGEQVLRDISVTIEKGDYVGIIGPNGGGKTTMLKIILGLISPSKGSIRLFDQDIGDFKDWSKIGYLSQRAAHFNARFPITAYEVVSQGRIARAGLFKRFSGQDRIAIENALKTGGIDEMRNKLLAEMSGGERQRVFIARALASEPEVLILDEPAAGVDVGSQSKFYQFLKYLNEHRGITIVFVSHDIDIMAQEATNLICVNNTLVGCGSPEQILGDRRRIFEALYGKNTRFILDQS